MKSMTITGLSKQQKLLCDLIWSCEYMDDVNKLIKALPESAKHDAKLVFELIVAAEYDNVDEIDPTISELLDKYR